MIGIIIVARLGSSRLPGKHLMKINQFSVIEWLIKRIQIQLQDEDKKIIIATSNKSENQGFKFLEDLTNGVEVFFGDDGNIPLRIRECARHYNFDSLICFGGDNPLTSLEATKIVIKNLKKYDYVETEGLPIGMNVFGFTRQCLETNLTEEYVSKTDLEFAWNNVFKQNNNSCLSIKLGNYDLKNSDLRVTLDYLEDFEFFKKLFTILGDDLLTLSDKEMIETMLNHELYLINNHLTKEYWNRFDQGTKKTF